MLSLLCFWRSTLDPLSENQGVKPTRADRRCVHENSRTICVQTTNTYQSRQLIICVPERSHLSLSLKRGKKVDTLCPNIPPSSPLSICMNVWRRGAKIPPIKTEDERDLHFHSDYHSRPNWHLSLVSFYTGNIFCSFAPMINTRTRLITRSFH